jgi:hypothetical protein
MKQLTSDPRSWVKWAGWVFAVVLIGAALAGSGLRLRAGTAIAAEPEAAGWFTCAPANVAAYTSRIHVKCTAAAPGGILYFAYPTKDNANASRFLSVLSTALVAGKQVDILFDSADLSGTTYGCGVNDCRPIIAVALWP